MPRPKRFLDLTPQGVIEEGDYANQESAMPTFAAMNESTNKLPPSAEKTPSKKKSFWFFGILFVALILGGGSVYYFYSRTPQTSGNNSANASSEVKSLVNRVGALIVLPQDEVPTVATVTDPALLKDQPFFANAKKGDRVLIYPKAQKAILYDPELNKIIEVAPVALGGETKVQPSPDNNPPSTQDESTPKSKKSN